MRRWCWIAFCSVLATALASAAPAVVEDGYLKGNITPEQTNRALLNDEVPAARAAGLALAGPQTPDDLTLLQKARAAFQAARPMRPSFLQNTQPLSPLAADPRYIANALTLLREASTETPDKPSSIRIIGGISAPAATRDVVALLPRADSIHGGPCSGVLIGQVTILTAAHCVDEKLGNPASVQFSAAIQRSAVTGVAWVTKRSIFQMPGAGRSADLAIITIDRPASAFGGVPRPLASGAVFNTWASTQHDEVIAVGYGWSCPTRRCAKGERLFARIPVATARCDGSVGATSDEAYYGCLKDAELVAEDPQFLRDTCYGDSGGPIYVHDAVTDQDLVAGITSRARGKAALCGMGSIFGLVVTPAVISWIERVTGQKAHVI